MKLDSWMRAWRLYSLQRAQFERNCHPNVPEWYETKRKTTHVIFWRNE